MTDFDPTPFSRRHIGPDGESRRAMLKELGCPSLEEFIDEVVPARIRASRPLAIGAGRSEEDVIAALAAMSAHNRLFRSFIGMGYHDTVTPAVIVRNVLENPGWYTAYTPYQAEVAQGRLEALLNFQTMVTDLTGMDIANASLLDESTAAAEAMTMFHAIKGHPPGGLFFVSDECHPQNIEVVRTRARPLGIRVVVGSCASFESSGDVFGALVQYPATDGAIHDYRPFCDSVHAAGALVVCAADLMSLLLLAPPAEFGADAAVGSTQRFGVPLGYGGPHAAYFATRDIHKRHMPGRIIGVSVDAQGNRALRMALQTREQHIRREKATSNVCTAQVLLAVMASMYAVYHGPQGLRRVAERLHGLARMLSDGARAIGHGVVHDDFFDTVRINPKKGSLPSILHEGSSRSMNFRAFPDGTLGIALDELTDRREVMRILGTLAGGGTGPGGGEVASGHGGLCGPAPPDVAVSHAPGVQPSPQRDRDAPLSPRPGVEGPGPEREHDPSRIVHDETDRHVRDDPGDLAGTREAPSVRTSGAGRRVPRDVRRAQLVACGDHRVPGRVAAAERRRPG